MSDLYDADVLEWSEQQARLLRDAAAGRLSNPRKSQDDFAEPPDWANIIEEIESVGRSQFNAVQSLLVMALLHDLKLAAWPQPQTRSVSAMSRDVPHWRAEARGFRRDAQRQFTPSMSGEPLGSTRRKLDMARLYADALDRLPETMDGQPPLPVPPVCPVTLDELLGA